MIETAMIREWLTLLRLARRRFRSNDDYRQFQVYQGHLILHYLTTQGISVQNLTGLWPFLAGG